MKKKLIIKLSKIRAGSNDNYSKLIVIGYNNSKVNGLYIEKLGIKTKRNNRVEYYMNTYKIGYWLNKGAKIKKNVSKILGILSLSDTININEKT